MIGKQQDDDKFKVVILNREADNDAVAEERTVQVLDDNGKAFNLQKLIKAIKNVHDEQKDKCKDIASLGGGICGNNDEVNGFVLGWITSKIIQSYEDSKGTKCHINVVDTKDLTRDDLMMGTAELFEEMAKYIRENIDNEEVNINKLPTNPFNGLSQYD